MTNFLRSMQENPTKGIVMSIAAIAGLALAGAFALKNMRTDTPLSAPTTTD